MKKAKARKVSIPRIHKVALPPAGVVEVKVPPGVVPVVQVDPVRRVVEIVPVPKAKRGWWARMFE